MGSLDERNRSLWVETTPATRYPPLNGMVNVDVAVIGAGITGLLVATLLKRTGARVAVIEAGRVAAGATGYTTAKVTSQHGLVYRNLVEDAGAERARMYADANQAAIERIAALVADDGIDCDFQRASAYTYTENTEQLGSVQAEVEAAQRLGLPASFTETVDLPWPVQGAVRFDDQAMFHPRKFCLALAEAIPGDGSHLFELTRAQDVVSGSPCKVETDGGEVHAQQVVLATQIPFLDRGGFFARTHPSRSYAIGVHVDGELPEGMYLSADSPVRSVRPYHSGGDSVLILGGEGHKVGQDEDTRRRYSALEEWARHQFEIRSIDYRWSAQDYIPVDDVPYIGQLTPASERILVATGFKKWGMTTGMVAAMILSDIVLRQENPWQPVFDSTRVDLKRSAKSFVVENTNVAKRLVGDRLALLNAPSFEELPRGEGRVVEMNGEKVAVHKDDNGIVHAVSPFCTHMGCTVTWNTAERTWDCPCHGSRFDRDGHAIQGPTVQDLEKRVPGPK